MLFVDASDTAEFKLATG
jgi:hypothetical protein